MLSEAREASEVEAPTALRLRRCAPPLSVTKRYIIAPVLSTAAAKTAVTIAPTQM